jgi:hypothetical protein
MKGKVQLRVMLVVVGTLAATATVWLSVASATNHKPSPGVSPAAVLTWNTYTVNAVRASSPTKFQTDGMVYMSYAEAAVYDAVTKMMGRYQPYHDFAFNVVPGASVQAAVAAATQTILDHYLPDQQSTVDAEYNAYLRTLTGNDPARAVAAAAGPEGADAVHRDDAPVPAGEPRAVPGAAPTRADQ